MVRRGFLAPFDASSSDDDGVVPSHYRGGHTFQEH
jgi:hypothetical protein